VTVSVAITAAGESPVATPAKVVASVEPTGVSLRISKPAAASLRASEAATAAYRSTSESATSAAHRAPSETTAAAHRTAAVHPAAAAAVTTTTTVTLSHCRRSQRESEHQCCRSNRLEFTHRVFPLLERELSP
jgi:hypothetical protein